MAFLRPDLVLAEKVLAIGGLVALFGGFAALIYGEFAPSVGFQGLVDQGIGGAGFLAMGAGVLCFVPLVARDPWRARPRTSEGRRMARRKAAREACIIALNLVCYVGTAFVALGALTALDRAPIAAGATFVLCVATFLLYRRQPQEEPPNIRTDQAYRHRARYARVQRGGGNSGRPAGFARGRRHPRRPSKADMRPERIRRAPPHWPLRFTEHRGARRRIHRRGRPICAPVHQGTGPRRAPADCGRQRHCAHYILSRTGVFVDAEPLGENRATDGISGAS